MKKVWKWVIGIVVVLVVVAALVGSAFLLRNHFANVVAFRVNRPGLQVPSNGNGQRLPGSFPGMRPFGNDGWGGYGMHIRGRGMMGFGGVNIFGWLIRGLFSLGFLALIILGIIWLVNRLRKPVVVAAPVAPLAATHPCSRCGEPIQEGWKHCPNCGKKQ